MKYIKICFTCFFFYLPVAPGEYADIPLEDTSTVSPVGECHTSSALCHFSHQAKPAWWSPTFVCSILKTLTNSTGQAS